MFNFRNIDEFIPYKFEKVGMLKGKRWYVDSSNHRMGLFKPKRYAFKNRKVFCANHYGEFIGNKLAVQGDIDACETELAHLSKYYSNIHKEIHNGTPEEKDGCIIYSQLSQGNILEPGKVTIERFKTTHVEDFKRLIKDDISMINVNDNIEVVLASIESRVRDYYRMLQTQSETYIQERVQEVRRKVIQMVVYDNLYGNYDRHDENWSMYYLDNGDIDLYPLYDNEKVLGLYEAQNFIEDTLREENIEQVAEEKFFSRMRVPGEKKKYSTYKDVLTYLMKKYTQETTETVELQLNNNTPQQVRRNLENCERLPDVYIDFETQMYEYRNNFAKDLLERNKYKNSEQTEKESIQKKISGEER